MSDYTPTTEEVLTHYLALPEDRQKVERWLNDVKAQAWEEGALTVYQDNSLVGGIVSANPYRQENK